MALQVPRDGLEQKLQKLSQSQQSIESVSSFCIFYHKDARGVVNVWDQQFYKAPTDRKIALLYLANHILQEGRKKSTGFQEEFFQILPNCIRHLANRGDDKTKRVITRLVNVWEERRVFGTRHIKSFKEVLGVPSSEPRAAADSAPTTGGTTTTAATKLGPVGDALSAVLSKAADAAAKGQQFTNSWSQGVLTTGSLADVTACHSKLSSYSAALQEELAARQAAVAALSAELAKQNAELGRAESQIAAAGNQKAQLDQRLMLLTSQMSSAMASLGQMFQQNGGSAVGSAADPTAAAAAVNPAAAAAGFTAREASGSPEAPDLELEPDDELAGLQDKPVSQGGPLQQAQQQQQPLQQQPVLAHDLQALLQNPQLLSAAITGSMSGAAAASNPGAIATQSGPMLQVPVGGPADGMRLQIPSGPVMGAAAPWHVGSSGDNGVGYDIMGGAGFGGLGAGIDQQQFGFADEADDPYDPEHPD